MGLFGGIFRGDVMGCLRPNRAQQIAPLGYELNLEAAADAVDKRQTARFV